jgi:hypothetical protein
VDFDPDPNNAHLILSAGNFNSYLIKLDSEGSFLWGKHFSGSSSVLAQDFYIYNSDVYYAGNFQGSMKIFPENTPSKFSAGVNDLFIAKFDVDGTLDTLIAWGSVRNDDFSSVAIGPNGIFLAGTFLTEIDIDPDPQHEETLISNGGVDAFVLALDSAFQFLWVKHYGGSSFELADNLFLLPDGQLLYSFRYNATITLDVMGDSKVLTSQGETDVALLKLDQSNGDINSVYAIKGTSNEYVLMPGFIDGDFMLSGAFEGSTDFDDTPSSNHIITSRGVTDCFLLRIDLGLISGYHDIIVPQPVHLFPVPLSPGETLHFSLAEFNGVVQIFDAYGSIISTEHNTSQQLQIPSKLIPGIYYALLKGSDGLERVGRFAVK